MVNFGPLTAKVGSGVWGTPSKFQRVSRLGFVTAPSSRNGSQPNFARCLAVCWARTLYIHFCELLPPDGILPGAKFTLRPSLAFSYIEIIIARHSSSGRQPNCGVQQRAPPIFGRAATTLDIGPQSSSFFFLAYSQRSIGSLPYFHTRCGLSENLECRSEMCSMLLAKNTVCKTLPSGTIAQLFLAVSSQLSHRPISKI